MTRRVAIVGFWHETNTYASTPTTLADFEAFELLEGVAIVERNRGTGSVIGGFLDADDAELVPCVAASAWPGGLVAAEAVSFVIERTVARLREEGPFDGVLANLHGAMVADGDPDPELTFCRAVADACPGAPIAGVLDLHANPSTELIALCDVVVGYDTYPHVDMRERGAEAASFLRRLLDGERLETHLAKTPILAAPLVLGTEDEPMRGLQRRALARAERAGLARISVLGGFAYSDVERAGMSVLAVCAPERRDEAQRVLEETIADIEEHTAELKAARPGPARAVAAALRADAHPVVLADVGDNVGGGSAGDGTALLRELLAQGARSAVMIVTDPVAVGQAEHAGVGGRFAADVGGRTDELHGAPVRVEGTVVALSDGRYEVAGTWMRGQSFEMGTTAVVDAAGTLVVLTARRVPPFHAEQLTSVGIDPGAVEIIVAKGAVAWRAAFGDVARTVIEVDTPGICPVDPAILPRTTTPTRV